MKNFTRYLSIIPTLLALSITSNAQTVSTQERNNVSVSAEIQTKIQEAQKIQSRPKPKKISRALTATYVGSFSPNDGPYWNTNPTVYTGQEAAALIFGGNPSDYAISTNSNTTDPLTITHTAHASSWGTGCLEVAEDYSLDTGNPGYNDPPAQGAAVSAYVQDYCYNGQINYVWLVLDSSLFTTTWETTSPNESIFIPTNSTYTYNYSVDWGDGNTSTSQTGNASHTYVTPGTYSVKITGSFPSIKFGGTSSANAAKLLKINQWGTQVWEALDAAFEGCTNLTTESSLDAPIFAPGISLANMFKNCSNFNSNLNNWDLTNVTRTDAMFDGATVFNGNITNWNVANVTNMDYMFKGNSFFNQPIGSWNTSNVTSMFAMFDNASSFNQNISNWNVANVTNMKYMFKNAISFDQNLGSWNVSNVAFMDFMFDGVTLSNSAYDGLLNGWSALSLQSGVTFNVGNSHYCNAEIARNNIVNTYGWTITDGGKLCVVTNHFTTKWLTTAPNETITIPTNGGFIYDYDVDWENNGIWENNFTGDATHTYTTPGTHTVAIRGSFPSIYFNNSGSYDKIISIEKWGSIVWESMKSAFYGCYNLVNNATDSPDLSQVTDMSNMLNSAISFNGDLTGWDVSNVENMSDMFYDNDTFNGNISSWDVSNVTGMSQMFMYASAFNEDIGSWDVGSVTDMDLMFLGAATFNQDIGSWNVGSVESMSGMFYDAYAFNQDIGNWNVSNVENMDYMFYLASSFNQDLHNWNVESVYYMDGMFEDSALSTINYDRILNSWSKQNLQYGVNFGVGTTNYCTGQDGRTNLINNFGWTITDGGQNCAPCLGITEYTTAGIWSNGTPNNTMTAIFKNDYNTSLGNIDACSIEIRSGVTLTVSEGTTIKAANNLVIDGNLIFKSSALGNGELGAMGPSALIYGDATAHRYMSTNRSYRMVSSAVTTATSIHDNWQEGASTNTDNPALGFGTHITGRTTDQVDGFDGTITGNPSMFTVNISSQNFEPVPNTDVNTLTAGNPYLLFVRGDRNINLGNDLDEGETVLRATGRLVSGVQTQNFASEDAGDFVMFGNPYQSVVDVTTVFANSTNLNASHYFVYDPTLGDHGAYVTVNLPGGTNTSSSAANQYLQPGQGAQVATFSAGPSTVVFSESDKATGNFTSTNRPLSEKNMLTVQLFTTENFNNRGPVHDSFGMVFSESNDNALTPDDAIKPMNFYENLGINLGGNYLSLEQREMPKNDEVYQLFSTGYQQSEYTLKLSVEGLEETSFYLEDNFTGTSIPLTIGDNTYSFNVNVNDALSVASNRFSIRPSQRLGVENNNVLAGIRLYPNPLNGDTFFINVPRLDGKQLKVTINDVTGREIFSQSLECNANTVTVPMGNDIASGIYMVSLENAGESRTYRLIKN